MLTVSFLFAFQERRRTNLKQNASKISTPFELKPRFFFPCFNFCCTRLKKIRDFSICRYLWLVFSNRCIAGALNLHTDETNCAILSLYMATKIICLTFRCIFSSEMFSFRSFCFSLVSAYWYRSGRCEKVLLIRCNNNWWVLGPENNTIYLLRPVLPRALY